MIEGTHSYIEDARNKSILINVNGQLFPREEAKISVFDSGFLLGDGVWEGIRLLNGQLVFIEEHIKNRAKITFRGNQGYRSHLRVRNALCGRCHGRLWG